MRQNSKCDKTQKIKKNKKLTKKCVKAQNLTKLKQLEMWKN